MEHPKEGDNLTVSGDTESTVSPQAENPLFTSTTEVSFTTRRGSKLAMEMIGMLTPEQVTKMIDDGGKKVC
jgi:hypothetical protein